VRPSPRPSGTDFGRHCGLAEPESSCAAEVPVVGKCPLCHPVSVGDGFTVLSSSEESSTTTPPRDSSINNPTLSFPPTLRGFLATF